MKKPVLLLECCTCFLIYSLLRFPDALLTASAEGVQLWLTKVFPSLFPFLAACGILLRIGAAQRMGKLLQPLMQPLFRLPGVAAFPFFFGILSGYPMGAKLTALLYKEKQLSLADAQHLLAFSNCPGPLFLIGTVGVGFFGTAAFGYLLWLSALLGAVCTGLFLRFRKKRMPSACRIASVPLHAALTEVLSHSVADALQTILLIGGYLILFGVLSAALTEAGLFSLLSRLFFFLPLSAESLRGILSGLLEMTNGAFLLSRSADALPLRLGLTAFLVSFGGFSILGQTLGVLAAVPISKKDYLKGKLLHALFSSLSFSMLYPIFQEYTQKEVPVFFPLTETSFSFSFLRLLPLLFFLAVLGYAFVRRE
nr:nucleoside recognition domain-containing protein [uncultured Anaerotignum sp.]